LKVLKALTLMRSDYLRKRVSSRPLLNLHLSFIVI